MLLIVELMQLFNSDPIWEYFVGWNLLDVFHMINFGFIYYIMLYTDLDEGINEDYLQLL
jgi:hypothetical protein